ncbi:MAG: DUF1259 domain-containing protein [Ignavibacteria bacterium]|jgi:hypothetical protein|nr:DUF1259 domain-containing protein [Ignavibacteria bacterium]MCU7511066.1 DUF1259 domain-containing protein [Ignavibacteria bacterium]MCU7522645.1 DUF1259 domain-containing protein [Ignavibacteria bacterium]MCU7525901.1 DUF1259 domain-containing protein [Ignavibacteria bacterium]HEX2927931.1 DUF1259 domain-containing protein [Ruminiclostridium sp.]
MRNINVFRLALSVIFLTFFTADGFSQTKGWEDVEKIIGKTGKLQGDVFKITFPRSDLNVKVAGVKIEPALALTGWIAFKKMGSNAMLMGDMVLLETEVEPAMKKAVENGLEITALHNHVLKETPQVIYMHVGGMGSPTELAQKIKSVISQTKIPLTQPKQNQTVQSKTDWSKVQSILGTKGQMAGDILQISVPREDKVTENGDEIPTSMGMATSLYFQKVKDKAVTTGDFVLIGEEVNPVIKALVQHNIAVTAVHNHMLSDNPRIFFLHFWGNDTPENLAKGLKDAIFKTKSKTETTSSK